MYNKIKLKNEYETLVQQTHNAVKTINIQGLKTFRVVLVKLTPYFNPDALQKKLFLSTSEFLRLLRLSTTIKFAHLT
uniref:Uncharacterized protein n=1 Tax=Anguilla anguilla TaxID=7936 RepID=A0A0E9W3E1_ANGAN